MENHIDVICQAAGDYYDGLELLEHLQTHIEHRLKHYTKCITKSTPNYLKYLLETYNRQVRQQLRLRLEDE